MQNRYAGDVGDFGKFGLLRHLFTGPEWRLGIVWYLYPDQDHSADGKFVEYLTRADFRECDADLHRILEDVVRTERSVAALEKAGLLPANTVYFSDMCDFYKDWARKEARALARRRWLEDAVSKLSECNAVFLDPDNGLEVASCSAKTAKEAGKYAYYDEVAALSAGKDAGVVYQHFDRSASHREQMRRRIRSLRERVNPSGAIYAVRYRAYSPRMYVILTSRPTEPYIEGRMKDFLQSRWQKLWDSLIKEGTGPLAS